MYSNKTLINHSDTWLRSANYSSFGSHSHFQHCLATKTFIIHATPINEWLQGHHLHFVACRLHFAALVQSAFDCCSTKSLNGFRDVAFNFLRAERAARITSFPNILQTEKHKFHRKLKLLHSLSLSSSSCMLGKITFQIPCLLKAIRSRVHWCILIPKFSQRI